MPRSASELQNAMEVMTATLIEAGLEVPPVPEAMRPALRVLGKWRFATRPLPCSPYFLQHYLDELGAGEIPDYVALAHAGHGANSYAIHYFQVNRRLRLFLKVDWGGIYMNPEKGTARVNECFRLARELTAAVEAAHQTGQLGATDRMTVVAADFESSAGWWVSRLDAKEIRQRVAGRQGSDKPREMLREALDFLKGEASCTGNPYRGELNPSVAPRSARSRHLRTGVVSVIGGRKAMEDRYILLRKGEGLLGGVFDGHGGKRAADRMAEALPGLFFGAMGKGRDAAAAFRETYAALDRATRRLTCGTSATCFFLFREALTVAHVGDGRCVVLGERPPRILTEDHRVEHPGERARIELAGGEIQGHYVYRNGRGLMLTRSFGDRILRPAGVMAIPDLITGTLTSGDRWLVAACDGLWDVLGTREVAGLVIDAANPEAAADTLAEAVAYRRGRDNLTILVVERP